MSRYVGGNECVSNECVSLEKGTGSMSDEWR